MDIEAAIPLLIATAVPSIMKDSDDSGIARRDENASTFVDGEPRRARRGEVELREVETPHPSGVGRTSFMGTECPTLSYMRTCMRGGW